MPLAEAHALGIVHRDLKPANLFLTARADGSPCIKVLDFGISKVTNPGGSGSDLGMTRTQSIMGSPLYMSPEQLASAKDVDPRTDVWAIGCVLYELLCGRPPFEAETMPQLCTLILHVEPAPLRSIRPDVPEPLERAILRCLRKDRAQRYANVAALAADLAVFAPDAGPRSAERISRVLSSSGITTPELVSSNFPSRTAGANTGGPQAWGTTQPSRSNRAVWLGAGGVLALAVIGGVAWRFASVAHVAPPPAAALAKPPRELPSQPPAVAAPVVSAKVVLPPVVSAAPSGMPPVLPTKPVGPSRPQTLKKPGGAGTVDPLSERN